MKELGIEVVIKTELPKVEEAFGEFLAQVKNAQSVGKVKPTAEQAMVEKAFPAIAKWVYSYGHIEIGDCRSSASARQRLFLPRPC